MPEGDTVRQGEVIETTVGKVAAELARHVSDFGKGGRFQCGGAELYRHSSSEPLYRL